MNKNQKCIVSESSPHHANRVGYFQFYGTGSSNGVAVLTEEPVDPETESRTYFAVSVGDIQTI